MGLPPGRWQQVENQFFPLLISVLLPILFLPSTAQGDSKSLWVFFALILLIVVQSLRSLPTMALGPSSPLWVLCHRLLGGLAGATTLAFVRYGEDTPLAFKAMLFSLSLFFVLTSVRLVTLLARVPRVNGKVMAGAAAGYLLLGLTGGVLASMTQSLVPGAFLLGKTTSHQALLERLTYYSFVTLGGLGYGDVLPGNAYGERFAILLSVAGNLYVVLLVGLLLGRFIASEEVRFLELDEEEHHKGHRPRNQ